MYHELGHVLLDHPLTNEGRLDGISKDIVSKYELEADNFAVFKMGKESVINWLEDLINRISFEIDLREDAKRNGRLNEQGDAGLKRCYLIKREVLLRIQHINDR